MKNLLTENEIRKMMKYADMNTLADGFVQRLTEDYIPEEELPEDDEEEEVDMSPVEPTEELPPEPPPVGEPEMGASADGDIDVEALVADLADMITKHTGVSVEVEEEGGEGMDLEPEAGLEPEMDAGPEMGTDPSMDAEAEMPPEEDEETLEEVVNMIARRVAKRILTEQ